MEPIVMTEQSETETAENELFLPSDPMLVIQIAQFLILFVAALYVARQMVLPVVLAILLKLLLQPGVRRLERLHLPRSAAAALMIFAVFSVLGFMGTALSGPAREWAGKLPAELPRLRERLSFISGPLESFGHLTHDAELFLKPDAGAGNAPGAGIGLSDMLLSGTTNFASGFLTTIVVLYFLLIAGDIFLRRLVEILPRFRDKRAAVTISQQIESNIAAYLMTVTAMNAAVGVLTALLMWAAGLGNPLLWGVLAFLLNYIPIIGAILCAVILLLAGLMTLEPLWLALVPAVGFLTIHIIEGQFVTPILVAKRFTLNPVVVIVSLIFWYWMWGVPGAILAVPALGMVKIICDGIRPWAAFGHLIEG